MVHSSNRKLPNRGCVFFNFGDIYILRLLVSLYTLRKHYDGPVNVAIAPNSDHPSLRKSLDHLECETVVRSDLSKSAYRHVAFKESPFDTTLVFDSDLIFQSPIDELWEPIERDGLLVTRLNINPFGIDGTPDNPGHVNRMADFAKFRELLGEELYRRTERQILEQHIDVNVGVMGISSQTGQAFLDEWSEFMERGRPQNITLMDEILTVALMHRHRYFLADESWNCPADEFFRSTNLADAKIIHYFSDGLRVYKGIRLGRNPVSWAGKKWYDALNQAAAELDLAPWIAKDPIYTNRFARYIAKKFAVGNTY